MNRYSWTISFIRLGKFTMMKNLMLLLLALLITQTVSKEFEVNKQNPSTRKKLLTLCGDSFIQFYQMVCRYYKIVVADSRTGSARQSSRNNKFKTMHVPIISGNNCSFAKFSCVSVSAQYFIFHHLKWILVVFYLYW